MNSISFFFLLVTCKINTEYVRNLISSLNELTFKNNQNRLVYVLCKMRGSQITGVNDLFNVSRVIMPLK